MKMNLLISKKFLIIIAAILILIIGIGIGLKIGKINVPLTSNASQEINPARAVFNGVNNENLNRTNLGLVKVIRVIDGDTIEIEGKERVRYIGIDTPETVDPRKPVQCFGIESAKKNKELVEGKTVRLEKDITERDKYNRLLRYVWLDDVFVNLELVKQGFAYSYSYPPDIKYQEQILKAQQEAREVKRGLWSACSTIQEQSSSSPISPASTPNGNLCLIKGNINASAEKIYHLPECGSYTKTKIEENRGEYWFCSETEAQSAGWRKALNCP